MTPGGQASVGNQTGRPRLLVVPHVYAENISVREIEFARRLIRHFKVYCLAWDDAIHFDGENSIERKWKQFRTALGSAMARQKQCFVRDDVTYISAPVLQPILLQRLTGSALAVTLCQSFNRHTLESLADRLQITHILLAAGTFAFPRRPGIRAFFDVVDWVPEDRFAPDLVDTKRRELKMVARKAQDIFVVSEPLCEKLRRDCDIVGIPMPNGADIKALRAVSPTEIASLRHNLGLDGRFVIGYIGNHGSYTGVDFVVDVFRRVRQCIPDAALVIVGPAEYWRSLLDSSRAEGVIWTGPVPPSEIGKYFNMLDVGILAQEKTLGTELAFQIKVVEYSACHKFVVSTPLRTWELLNWPNVFLAELQVEAWVKAIVKARQSEWNPEWDDRIDPFDWNALADRMAAVMLGSEGIEDRLCAS
jgi:glycosyltransferase involved in cell wall biosynthesis